MNNRLGLLVIVFAFTAISQAQTSATVAVLTKAVNKVEAKVGSAAWSAAKVGLTLKTGDEVKTGNKSLAIVKFTDNSLLRVRENTSIKIYSEKKGSDINKNTHIEKGTVGFNVKKQSASEEFKFTTPTMVASIRGTEGFVQVTEEGNSILAVTEGSVEVTPTDNPGNAQTVGAGNFAEVTPSGEIKVGEMGDGQKKDAENSKKSNTKKIQIQTSQGTIIIEYLVD